MEHHLCVLIVLSNPNCLVTILHPQLSIISRSNKSHPLTSSVSNVKKVALHYCHCYQLEHTSLYQFSDPRIEGKYAEGNKKNCVPVQRQSLAEQKLIWTIPNSVDRRV